MALDILISRLIGLLWYITFVIETIIFITVGRCHTTADAEIYQRKGTGAAHFKINFNISSKPLALGIFLARTNFGFHSSKIVKINSRPPNC